MQMSGAIAAVRNYRQAWVDASAELKKNALAHRESTRELSTTAAVMGGALVVAAGYAIAKFAEFDHQMSAVQAALRETDENMDLLRAAAIEAGKATAFSATEAGQAIEELGKAGVSTKDILNGGLQGALSLASAGALGVAEAAEIAAMAMQQFKLSGEQVPHIADLLAAAAGKSLGSVADLGMALEQSGLVLNQFGVDIEEGTGALAAFASAGLIGSDAGTSLKTMLLALAAPSSEAAGIMDDLGIAAYDASGQFVGLKDLAGQLQTSMQGLTQAERDHALATIFGTDAVRAANVLYSEGSAGIATWTRKVDDAGYASEVAAERLNNLKGDLTILQSSLDTALIQTGSGANDAMRFMAQTATELVNAFASLPGPVQTAGLAIVGIGGAGLLAVGGLGNLVVKAAETREALAELRASSSRTNRVMGRMAKGVGIAGAAMATFAAVNAVAGRQVTYDLDLLAKRLGDFASSGNATGEMARLWGNDLDLLANDVNVLERSWHDLTGTTIAAAVEWATFADVWSDTTVESSKERIEALDAALAQMVASGHAENAADAFRRVADAAAAEDVTIDELREGLPQYQAAIEASAGATDAAAQEQRVFEDSLSITVGTMEAAIEAAGGLREALDILNGAAISTDEAIIRTESSLDSLSDAIDENREAFVEDGGAADEFTLALDYNTEAGRENMTAILDVAQAAMDAADAVYQETGSVESATETYNRYREELGRVLSQAGLTDDKVEDLINTYMGLPGSAYTDIDSDAKKEEKSIAELIDEIHDIPSYKHINIHTQYSTSGTQQGTRPYQYYSRGGVATRPTLAMVAEAGHPESIISHDPKHRARSLGLWRDLGRKLGVRPNAPASATASAGSHTTVESTVRLILDSQGAGRELDRFMQKLIRVKANGNVQKAIGGRR
ncbi:phage tail tape measure protein [Glycomyces tarimensis]